ncbi:protoglobin family protein [Bacillus sp. 4A_MP2]
MLFKKESKKKNTAFFTQQDDGIKRINFPENTDIAKQIKMIDLTQQDLFILKQLNPIVQDEIEHIVDKFYKNLEVESSLMHIIQDNSSVERLKKTLRIHISEMFAGVIDESYVAKRIKIAQVHLRIGLQPKWYMADLPRPIAIHNGFICPAYPRFQRISDGSEGDDENFKSRATACPRYVPK